MKKGLLTIAGYLVFLFVVLLLMGAVVWRPLCRLTSALMTRSGALMASNHRYPDAIVAYSHAIQWDPRNAQAFELRARARFELKDFYQTIEDSTRALDLNCLVTGGYATRGLAEERLRNYSAALGDFERAIQLEPSRASNYQHRGWLLGQRHLPALALDDFDHAIRLNPQLSYAYDDRSMIEIQSRDLDGARKDLDRALALRPDDARFLEHRAHVRGLQDDLPGAVQDLNEALRLQPLDLSARFSRSLILRMQGKPGDAMTDINDVLKAAPHYPHALLARGLDEYDLGKLDDAEADFEGSLNENGNRGYVELWLWVAATRLNGSKDADLRLSLYESSSPPTEDAWEKKIGNLLLGRTTPDVVAGQIDPTLIFAVRDARLCRLWYFAGEFALQHGDQKRAREDFTKAVATQAKTEAEFSEAQRELNRS